MTFLSQAWQLQRGHLLREDAGGVDGMALTLHPEMKLGRGSVARAADIANQIALIHVIARAHQNFLRVGVGGH